MNSLPIFPFLFAHNVTDEQRHNLCARGDDEQCDDDDDDNRINVDSAADDNHDCDDGDEQCGLSELDLVLGPE